MVYYYFSSISNYIFSGVIPGAARNFYGDTSDLRNNSMKYVTITQQQVETALKSLKPVKERVIEEDETLEDYMETHPKWNKMGITRRLSLYEIVSKNIKKSELENKNDVSYTKILRSYNKQVIKKKKLNKDISNYIFDY